MAVASYIGKSIRFGKKPAKVLPKHRRTLWVEVRGDTVEFKGGGAMPTEFTDRYWGMLMFSHNTTSRKEFERWSGLTLPKGNHILGLRVVFAEIERHRVVKEDAFDITKGSKYSLKRVK